jgi:hypothetical protein
MLRSFCRAVVFSLEQNVITKSLGLFLPSILLLWVQWLLLQTIGVFFEVFVPVFGLWLHSVVERVFHGFREKELHHAEP